METVLTWYKLDVSTVHNVKHCENCFKREKAHSKQGNVVIVDFFSLMQAAVSY